MRRAVIRYTTIVFVLTLIISIFGVTKANAYNTGNDYVPVKSYYNSGGGYWVSNYSFAINNCTDFVAWCLNSRNGVAFHNSYGGTVWGNGYNWDDAATSIGITVNDTPAVGSIAQTDNGTYGHVAWVKAVNGDTVTIDEYNYNYEAYSERTVAKSSFKYIHIQDIGNSLLPVSPGSQTIMDGDYYIVSALNTSKVLDVLGNSSEAGANVQIYSKHDESASEAQVFHVSYNGDGFYTIVNKKTGLSLDVDGGGTAAGTNVKTWTKNGNYAQQWRIDEENKPENEKVWYSLVSRCNGLYLDVDTGSDADYTNVKMYTGNNSNAQKWKFIPYGPSIGQQMADGIYHIASTVGNHDKGLDAFEAGTTSGTNVDIYSNLTNKDQTWEVKHVGNGYYNIINVKSGLLLHVADGLGGKGTNVHLYANKDSDNAKWMIKQSGNGKYYYIISKSSGYYLDVSGGANENYANVQVWSGFECAAQNWKFIPYGPAVGYTVKEGEYHIASAVGKDKGLDANGAGKTSGTNVDIYTNLNDPTQTWQLKYLGDGYYNIINVNSGLAMNVVDGSGGNGTNVILHSNKSTNNAKWLIQDVGNGYYYIVSKANNLNLDVSGGVNENYTNVQVWVSYNTAAQKWKFTPYTRLVTDIKINSDHIDLKPGESRTLSATITPSDATNKVVQWSSSDKSVATVNSSGVANPSGIVTTTVTAVAAGTATITVMSDNGEEAKCTVTVTEPTVSVTGVTLNKSSLSLEKDGIETLAAEVAPSNATNKNITWSSSDTSVATVDQNGKVTAAAAGTATITVKTEDGSKTAMCVVTVSDPNGSNEPSDPSEPSDPNEDDPVIAVQKAVTQAGNEVSVSITIANNPGITNMRLRAAYDENLTLIGVENGNVLSGAQHNTIELTNNPYTLYWANSTASSDITENGVIATLKFKVSDDAPEGLLPVTVSYGDSDIFNKDMKSVAFNVVNGGADIIEIIYGDIDGNGAVNLIDETILARYLAGWNDYKVLANPAAADVNNDGAVNLIDETLLARHLAGWNDYKTLPIVTQQS